MKHDLGGKVMAEFIVLRPKTYSYLRNHNDKKNKKQKAQKSVLQRKTLNLKIMNIV